MCLYGVLKYHLMHYLLTGFAKPLSLRVSEEAIDTEGRGQQLFYHREWYTTKSKAGYHSGGLW